MGIKFVIQRNQNDELQHAYDPNQPRAKDGKWVKTGVAVAESSSQILRGVQNISNEASKIPTEKGSTTYGKYPDISDEDLNRLANRLQLEHRYSDLKGDTKYTKSGSEKTREILQTIGAAAGVAASVASTVAIVIALTKKGPKKKK